MTFLHDDLTFIQLLIDSNYLGNQLELALHKKAQETSQVSLPAITNKLINNLNNQLYTGTSSERNAEVGKFFDKDLLSLNNFLAAVFGKLTPYNGNPIVHYKDAREDALPSGVSYIDIGDYKVNSQGLLDLLSRLQQAAQASNNKLLQLRIANLVKEMGQHKELAKLLPTDVAKDVAKRLKQQSDQQSETHPGKTPKNPKSKVQQVSFQQKQDDGTIETWEKEKEEFKLKPTLPFEKSAQGMLSILDITYFFNQMIENTRHHAPALLNYFTTAKSIIEGLAEEWKSIIAKRMTEHAAVQMFTNEITFGSIAADKIFVTMQREFGIYAKRAVQILLTFTAQTEQALNQIKAQGKSVAATIGENNIDHQIDLAQRWKNAFESVSRELPPK